MPFTPFHLGPALLFGFLFYSYLDLPALIVASIAVDIEPAIAVIFHLSYPWYGWFHHLEGSIVAVIVVTIVMYAGRKYTHKILEMFKLQQSSSFMKILGTSIFGVYFHLLLDFPLHSLLNQGVIPVELTPIGLAIYSFCTVSLIAGLILYQRKLKQRF